jgi:hypothetical protein
VKITVLVEGRTEKAFMPTLREFLKSRLAGRMPNIDVYPCNGRVPTKEKLRRTVEDLLTKRPSSDAVIALTDVYTGTGDFIDAADAKRKMHEWVGNNAKFHPHAAQHDFEAWLLPFWADIQRLAGSNRGAPGGTPESVDLTKPPSYRIAEVFEAGSRGRSYSKPRDAAKILQGKDLAVAASQCPELKAFLNTILTLSGAEPL